MNTQKIFIRTVGRRFLGTAILFVCVSHLLLPNPVTASDAGPLIVDGLEQVIIIDRIIADRAYENIKAGKSADDGIDFMRLDNALEKYRPELQKFDPAFYVVLRETYERMKSYVSDPNSDFVREAKNPGSVEFAGRSPLPAAAFEDSGRRQDAARPPDRRAVPVTPEASQSVDDLEPFLSNKAKKSLANIRKMPEETASAREAKLKKIEKETTAWEKNQDRLQAAVVLKILTGMRKKILQPGVLPRIDADLLPAGITPEMLEKMYAPPGMRLPKPTVGDLNKADESCRGNSCDGMPLESGSGEYR